VLYSLDAPLGAVAALLCASISLYVEQASRRFEWDVTQDQGSALADLPDPRDPVAATVLQASRDLLSPQSLVAPDRWASKWEFSRPELRSCAVLGDTVLAGGDGGKLDLLSASGEHLQRRDLGEGGRLHYFAATPDGCVLAVWEDGLEGRDGIAVLLDGAGEVLWRRVGGLRAVSTGATRALAVDNVIAWCWGPGIRSWARPLPVSTAPLDTAVGVELAVVAGSLGAQDWVSLVGAEDGRVRWTCVLPDETVLKVAIAPGAVLVTGFRGTLALEVEDGRMRWLSPVASAMTPLCKGGRVVLATPMAELAAVDLRDGQVEWRSGGVELALLGPPVQAGESILACASNGSLFEVDARDGAVLAAKPFLSSRDACSAEQVEVTIADAKKWVDPRPKELGSGCQLTVDRNGKLRALARS
jgi:PQQ-like domain